MIVRLLAILLFLQISTNAKSSDFGTVGLIDIPTARMSNDGTLTTSIAVQNRTKSVAITYQPMPWLETTFRYTGWKDWARWYDRNYEAKIRILEESNYMPQIAIGIRDLVGTGRWGSEYIVASKQINGIDYTFGMGWGRLAGDGDIKNPLTFLSDRFDSREKFRRAKDFGYGGKLSTDSFFSGEKVGFFGGASYKMPSLPLTLMIDYNPDEYYVEVKRGGQPSKSPVNAAVKWDIYSGTSVTFSHQHGEEWGIQFSSSMDTISQPQRQNRPYFKSSLDLNQAELPIGIDKNNWYQTLLYDVERSGILLLEATITDDDDHAVIVMGNTNFTIWQDAVAEMLKLSNKHLPKSVSRITILAEEEGHRVQSLTFPRLDSMNDINREIIQRKINIEPVDLIKVPQNRTSFYQGKIFFDYNLAIKTQFFDPDDPARYQFYAKIGARAALPNNWILFGAYSQNIYQNLPN